MGHVCFVHVRQVLLPRPLTPSLAAQNCCVYTPYTPPAASPALLSVFVAYYCVPGIIYGQINSRGYNTLRGVLVCKERIPVLTTVVDYSTPAKSYDITTQQ